MNKGQTSFIFKDYKIETDKKTIYFYYQVIFNKINKLSFTEKIVLPKEIPDSANPQLLEKVLQNLHLMLGVSYYKMHCSKKITLPYLLTSEQSRFWSIVYTKGLGEFFYRNKIDFRGLINFPYSQDAKLSSISEKRKDRGLVGIGGGKDSIVMVELLIKQKKNITGFVLKSNNVRFAIQKKVLALMEIDYLVVEREIDKQLFELNKRPGSYNGHVPISAIYAFIGLFLAVVYGFSEVGLAQEKSANEGNVKYLGEMINHQWSKSEEFEQLFRRYVKRFVTSEVTIYSIIRKYSELEIIKEFSQYEKYFSVFSSCNRDFWCGQCPKCAFIFLGLAAYLPKKKVSTIFSKNLLNDRELLPIYKDLLGLGKYKPFECVGTSLETKEALKLVINKGEFKEDYIIKMLEVMSYR